MAKGDFRPLSAARAKTWPIAAASFIGGGILLFLALRSDAFGTASNLIGDVIVAAVITLAVKTYLTKRSQKSYSRQFASARQQAIKILDAMAVYDKEWLSWATKGVHATLTLGDWLQWTLDHPTWDWSWNALNAKLELLSTEYGTVDFALITTQMKDKREEAIRGQEDFARCLERLHDLRPMDEIERIMADPTISESEKSTRRDHVIKQADQALTTVADKVIEIQENIDLLKKTLLEGYPPHIVATRRSPNPFPVWILYFAWGLGVTSIGLWIGAYLLPSRFPSGFAGSIANNVFSAGVAATVGVGFAALGSYFIFRQRLGSAARPMKQLFRATSLLLNNYFRNDIPERNKALGIISSLIHDNVNQLQHILPDARLDRYADLLTIAIETQKTEQATDTHNVPQPQSGLSSFIVADARWPITNRISHMTDLVEQLTDRAQDLYYGTRILKRSRWDKWRTRWHSSLHATRRILRLKDGD